jgi:hypothetical protein
VRIKQFSASKDVCLQACVLEPTFDNAEDLKPNQPKATRVRSLAQASRDLVLQRSTECSATRLVTKFRTRPAYLTHYAVGRKSSPVTSHGGAWGERGYSSYSFTTSALDGGEWSASRPGRDFVQEAGWTPEPVWTQRLEENSFAPAGDRTPIARSSSSYSDTILAELTRLHAVDVA